MEYRENAGYCSAYFPVTPGDLIVMSIAGYTGTSKGYVFIDADGNVVSRAPSPFIGKVEVIAPERSVVCAINNRLADMLSGYWAYKAGVMFAATQIESGKYFTIANTLYLSTTTIPAGDAIIPGTNCTKTDLAAALNALNA